MQLGIAGIVKALRPDGVDERIGGSKRGQGWIGGGNRNRRIDRERRGNSLRGGNCRQRNNRHVGWIARKLCHLLGLVTLSDEESIAAPQDQLRPHLPGES